MKTTKILSNTVIAAVAAFGVAATDAEATGSKPRNRNHSRNNRLVTRSTTA